MGDANQLAYLKHWAPTAGPVIEIGSKDYGSTSSYRDFYPGEYVGVDMAAGKGVEVVVDLCKGIGPLREGHFDLAICCSVLEHVEKPWRFAENLARLIRPGGRIYISVPWVWRYHAYPEDYFRFSHRGVASLFEGFTWEHLFYSTSVDGEFIPVSDGDSRLVTKIGERKHLPYLMVNMLGTR